MVLLKNNKFYMDRFTSETAGCTGELIYWTQDSWTFSGPNPAGAKNPLLLVGGGTDGFSQIILGGVVCLLHRDHASRAGVSIVHLPALELKNSNIDVRAPAHPKSSHHFAHPLA
jgi:hypothetical protein